VLILPMPLGAFQPPKPAPGGPATVFPWGENKNCQHLAMAGGYIYILGSHTGTLYIGVIRNLYLRVRQERVSQEDFVLGLRCLKSSERHG
jgi:hypothetical protein